jgi:hypothetical protein
MFNANGTFLDCCPELRGVSPIFNEINLPQYIPPKDDTLGSLVIGGLIHKEVRRKIRPLLKPGTSLLDLTRAIEKETIELAKPYNTINKGIGFPCGMAVNECAAHWAPSSDSKIIINKEDVIKIDYGVEINGWIIDSAFTFSFNKKYDNLLTAVKEATMHGIKTAGVDVDIHDWSRGIGEIMESYDIDLDGKNISQQKTMQMERELNHWEIIKQNIYKFEPKIGQKFDIIFADPPYDIPNIQQFPKMFSEWLCDDGIIILEHKPQLQFHEAHLLKKEYGSTTCTIFAKQK